MNSQRHLRTIRTFVGHDSEASAKFDHLAPSIESEHRAIQPKGGMSEGDLKTFAGGGCASSPFEGMDVEIS